MVEFLSGIDTEYLEGAEGTETFTHPVTGQEERAFKSSSEVLCSEPFRLVETFNPKTNYSQWVMLSPKVFIGDIDDLDFNWEAAVEKLKDQNYKVRLYRTYKGYRLFVLNREVSLLSEPREVDFLFNLLKCDKLYVNQCWYYSSYAARLTPKAGRYEPVVVQLVYSDSLAEVPSQIKACIATHDGFCLNYDLLKSYDYAADRANELKKRAYF